MRARIRTMEWWPREELPCAAGAPGSRSGNGAASVWVHLQEDAQRRASGSGPFDFGTHKVLVVDDTPASRYATVRMLQRAGFQTLEASAGAQALVLAEEASAVILDVHLPDIHGFEVCRLLRLNPRTASLAVIHLSAIYVTDEAKVAGETAGADAYLVSPVSVDVLATTVASLLTREQH